MSEGGDSLDVVIVGSGPNGLAAAVIIARAGLRVLVLEAHGRAGGAARTVDFDGLRVDIGSAVHPMALASPFFRRFNLAARGVRLVVPEISYAHPLDGGRAGLAYRSIGRTATGLESDGPAWRRLLGVLSEHPDLVTDLALGTHRAIPGSVVGVHGPEVLARFATAVLQVGTRWGDLAWRTDEAAALIGGVASHAIARLPGLAPGAAAVLLGALAHAGGWPIPVGGSQAITDALIDDVRAHGGEVRTDTPVVTVDDLPVARGYLFDTSPPVLRAVFGDRLSPMWRRATSGFRFGNAASRVDFVLSGPVPWAHPEIGRAGTVHLGGTIAQLRKAENEVAGGRHADHPVVLVSEPSVVDPTRTDSTGRRPLWTYAHVPAGSTVDVGPAVQAQIERFAPGFGDVVLQRRSVPAARMDADNRNHHGGDIATGSVSLWRMVARPGPLWSPYRAGRSPAVYLCSAATPPGPGVHGMAGLHAARALLRETFAISRLPSLAPADDDDRGAPRRATGPAGR